MTALTDRFSRRVDLSPTERRPALFLFAVLATIAAASVAARTARDALLLAGPGAARLPELYLASAGAVGLVCALLARLPRRVPQQLLFPIVTTMLGSSLLAARLALYLTTSPYLLAIIYVWVDVVCAAGVLELWLLSETTAFRGARTAERAADLGDAASLLVVVPTAGALWLALHRLDPADLLYAGAFLFWVAAGIGMYLAFRTRGRVPPLVAPPPWSPVPTLSEALKLPLLRVAGAAALVGIAARTFADYKLKTVLAGAFGSDAGGIARFLAALTAGAAVAGLVIQAGASRFLRSRLGVGGVPAFAAIFTTCAAIALLFLPGSIWIAALAVLTHEKLRFASSDPTMKRVVAPLPRRARDITRSFFDDFVRPLAIALAGGALLLARSFGTTRIDIPVLLLLAALVALLVLRVGLRTQHLRSFGLAKRRPGVVAPRYVFASVEAKLALVKELTSEDAAAVENAMELVHLAAHDLSAQVAPLTDNPTARVRELACEYLGQVRAKAHVDQVRARLNDRDVRVRAAAIRALLAIEGKASEGEALAFLDDGDPMIEAAAAVGLFQCGEIGRRAAWRALKALIASEDPIAREQAARALGLLGKDSDTRRIRALMSDPVPLVRRAAIEAAGLTQSRELVPALLEHLAHAETRRAALTALARQGERVLGELLTLHATNARVATDVVRLLGRIRTPEALRILTQGLEHASEAIRGAIAEALARAVRDDPERAVDRRALTAAVIVEASVAYRVLAVAQAFDLPEGMRRPGRAPAAGTPAMASALLSWALAEKHDRATSRAFYLLAALHPREVSQPPVPEARAHAIEAVAHVLDARLRRALLPLFAELPRTGILRAATGVLQPPTQSLEGWLCELLSDEDSWVVTGAAYHLSVHKLPALKDRLLALLDRPSPLVRETALTALEPLLAIHELPRAVNLVIWDREAEVRKRVDRFLERIVDHVELAKARGDLTRVYE